MRCEVVGDLVVRRAFHDPGGARKVAEERYVGHDAEESVDQPADGNRQPTALTRTGDEDAVRVDLGKLTCDVDGAHAVGYQPPVVVAVEVLDPARHHARVRGRAARRIGSVSDDAAGALTACVHDQVYESRTCPEQPFDRQPTPTAVPDILDDARQRPVPHRVGRALQPCSDRISGMTGEGDIVSPDGGQAGVDSAPLGRSRAYASIGESRIPSSGEVRRCGTAGGVRTQLIEGKVGVRHSQPFSPVCDRPSTKCRCARTNTISTGITVVADAASWMFHRCVPYASVYCVRASGSVNLSLLVR